MKRASMKRGRAAEEKYSQGVLAGDVVGIFFDGASCAERQWAEGLRHDRAKQSIYSSEVAAKLGGLGGVDGVGDSGDSVLDCGICAGRSSDSGGESITRELV